MNAVMTNQDLYKAAPSIFAAQPWHQMSEKYAFIPTIQVIDRMRQEGFQPVQAVQSRSRIEGKGFFTKHLVRFRDMRQGDQALAPALGQLYPELLLGNSHDGASAYWLDGGIYRLVCGNGLVVGDNIVSHMRVRHSGNADKVIDATYEIVEEMPKMLDSVEKFQAVRLEPGEQQAFATAALALRYDEGGRGSATTSARRRRRNEPRALRLRLLLPGTGRLRLRPDGRGRPLAGALRGGAAAPPGEAAQELIEFERRVEEHA
jgi:hypothetical protein